MPSSRLFRPWPLCLLLAIVAVAMPLSTWMYRARRQRAAVAALLTIKLCEVEYDGTNGPISPKPGWFDPALIKDLSHSVVSVKLSARDVDAAINHVKRLPSLRVIRVFPYDAKDEDEGRSQLNEAFSKLRRAVPRVKVEEAESAPILTSKVPIVG